MSPPLPPSGGASRGLISPGYPPAGYWRGRGLGPPGTRGEPRRPGNEGNTVAEGRRQQLGERLAADFHLPGTRKAGIRPPLSEAHRGSDDVAGGAQNGGQRGAGERGGCHAGTAARRRKIARKRAGEGGNGRRRRRRRYGGGGGGLIRSPVAEDVGKVDEGESAPRQSTGTAWAAQGVGTAAGGTSKRSARKSARRAGPG